MTGSVAGRHPVDSQYLLRLVLELAKGLVRSQVWALKERQERGLGPLGGSLVVRPNPFGSEH